MDPSTFQALVERAWGEVPREFRDALRGVVIEVRDRPESRQLLGCGMGDDEVSELLGLYEGVPLTERSDSFDPESERPGAQCIYLFREAILNRAGRDPRRVEAEIYTTRIHEIAHHFGLDEDRIDELGYG